MSEENMNAEKRKGNSFIFFFNLVSIGFQTILTFSILKNSATNGLLSKITTILFIIFLASFVLVTAVGFINRSYNKTALGLYKNSMKVVKYVLKLLLIIISVLNIIQATRLDFVALISSIFSLLLVILAIAFDVAVASVKHKWSRYRKRKRREKQERLALTENKVKQDIWLDGFRKRLNEGLHKDLNLIGENAKDDQTPFCKDDENIKSDFKSNNNNSIINAMVSNEKPMHLKDEVITKDASEGRF